MILKMLKKDLLRNKVISIAIFTFIMLSALFIASGTNMIIDLNNSFGFLIKEASAPHFVQYHSGDIDQEIIDNWSKNNPLVKQHQTCETLKIEGSKIYLNSNKESEHNTVMDLIFLKQNESFDYLLNLNNQRIIVNDGAIAVPILYMQENGLKVGDNILIKDENIELSYKITDFVRDVQMNSSLVSSKRFVVSESDFEKLKKNFGEIEYEIEFQLHDLKDISEFSNQYEASNLPHKGIPIDLGIIKILNSVTDGLIAAVIVLISLLINLIALLCLRFTILSTMEEDYREIGVMKAIGIIPKDIKRIYMYKYSFIAISASIVGFIISIILNKKFSQNIMLYFGSAPKSINEFLLPIFAAFSIAIIVIVFCRIILRRFGRISAIEAIRMGNTGETYKSSKVLALYRRSFINPNIFLGVRDVILRFKLYVLLFFVFILCTFIIIVPLNFFNTIQSSNVSTYMGIEKSDIFIDLRLSDKTIELFDEMVKYVEQDSDVVRSVAFITCQYDVINKDGSKESLSVGTGDFSVMSLKYVKGLAPKLNNEIALSFLSADELEKNVGDELDLLIKGEIRKMIVTGIYQDITNGGRTAKANIETDHDRALWYNLNIDVKNDVKGKVDEYKKLFKEAKIIESEDFMNQTFDNTISQLKLVIIVAIVLAILVAMLITSLFLKMLIAKDSSQIAIMRSIGVTLRDIRVQYITKSLVVLNLGIVIGTIMANYLGEKLFSIVLSFRGAPNFKFEVNPLQAYVLSPVILMVIVTITTLISIASIKQLNISDINQE
ncbi:ABC transporter permease [Oceanirhabdus sp. W0125-5]|uniref:ABC transporter permease n=1 Tax=Oceanirhabdus sp. W0125-5 TaxID=2999116 RepID=UPI0022F2FE92|nr:FtsX-like permease family protein [Oceanirhabdus sp. W0125-5]WBW95004.1 FtsX-like permease family protein [Oceanirhabdus sp. W0125-5]